MAKGRRILIVEDNEKNCKLFKLLVTSMGHECLVASDGLIGIELARNSRPDLILMDIQMPVLDGLATLRLLQKHPETRDIPVVAVTSYAMERDRDRLLLAGFSDYLAKPVDIERFKEVVSAILENRS